MVAEVEDLSALKLCTNSGKVSSLNTNYNFEKYNKNIPHSLPERSLQLAVGFLMCKKEKYSLKNVLLF